MKTKQLFWLFFLALTLFYLSLSPGSIFGQGYTEENATAASQIISNFGDWLTLRHAQSPVAWPRHGLFELLFQIPFLLLARLLFGSSPEWADRMLSPEPVLITSLLCTLIFVWVRRITSSLTWGYALATVAALSTMLWPYAYIGLETTQSLFVLLSGYLALGSDRKRTWSHALLFGLSSGLAISLKSNGIFLVPAVAFLCFVYHRGKSAGDESKVRNWRKTAAAMAIVLVLYELSAYTRSLSPFWASGTLSLFREFSVDSFLFNILSILASANKGLLIYCPVVILSLLGIQKAYQKNARIVIFACLTLGGLAGGCSLFFFYTDETWGPRYLHSAVAPLFICLALTRDSLRFRFRQEIPLTVLAACGVAVSFLGAFYYYGTMPIAGLRSGQVTTIETLQTDPNWNHIRFNLTLLRVWRRGGEDPAPWSPARHWWREQPLDAAPVTSINLRDYAMPQASLVRGWSIPKEGAYKIIWYIHLICLISGSTMLMWLGYIVLRKDVIALQMASGSESSADSVAVARTE